MFLFLRVLLQTLTDVIKKGLEKTHFSCLSTRRVHIVFFLPTGLCKAGSARRIIGSPRQLENAAPTNKNPHGVWV